MSRVGEAIARVTRAQGVREATLIVEVRSSSWLMELNLMKEEILRRVNEGRQEARIEKIVFVLSGGPNSMTAKKKDKRERGRSELYRPANPGSEGPRGRPKAPRDVHRVHFRPGASPPGLRGGGQLHRRGHGRVLLQGRSHDPRARFRHGGGRRPRHSGGHPPHREGPGGGAGHDHPPRRREVRQVQL